MIKGDPHILLSWTNTMLRDKADSLDDLLHLYGFKKEELIRRLQSIGYKYDIDENQFKNL
ncbi:hypothetical protein OXPF_09680 [Oxobacter pfennigii]|uniref:DUF4250 domain-containing protein n=2 Tax=Oxobacter pfennigii TaxID=36849 RepID=A0A0P8WAT0_9CLOT|nr:hypothetical protein OXPF_09680 [Oxobacter pfennigii]